tara:strand:+ start:454 stop:816 length:363 start_codon:yes stop_codon:yes gene_type:complete
MFTKGNKYGKGRPAGSQNKVSKSSKDFLKSVLFNEDEFLNDYKELDVNGRMELRIKLASYVLPKAQPNEEFERELPLFIDEPLNSIADKLGVTFEEPDEEGRKGIDFDKAMKSLSNKTSK